MKCTSFRFFLTIPLLACCTLLVHFYIQNMRNPTDTYDISFTQKSRKSILKSVCMRHNLKSSSWKIDPHVASQLMVEETHKFLYCEVPKVGCSNWKRIIILLKMNLNLKAEYLEHDEIHNNAELKRLSDYPEQEQKKMLETYIKVMFTRDPFQRLVSAYRDKLLHGVGYQGIEIPRIIKAKYRKDKKSTENVNFNEFVQYLLTEKPKEMDVHWRPMHYLCDPCNINYDFLGKLETVKKDSDYVLKVLGAPSALKYPEIKQFNESKTDTKTSSEYFSKISLQLIEALVAMYRLDFELFDYL
ncbi:carbohydrate sulfotransferase 8-like isoform 2-T2 [Anomaloglossus baeobatrachus]